MNEQLVSIIIPFYNVSDYIIECLESVASQTYPYIETILVDDCCTDYTTKKVEKFIDNHQGAISYKLLFHTQNRGQSAARNTGMDAATGDYIFFLDGDDYIYPECIELLIKVFHKESDIDWAFANFMKGKIIGEGRSSNNCIDGIYENVVELREKRVIYPMPWNCLYKADFLRLHRLRFLEGILHEDNLWTFEVACNSHKIAMCNNVTYFYRVRENSTMDKTFSERYPHFYTIHKEMIRYVIEHDFQKRIDVFYCLTQDIINNFRFPYFNGCGSLSYNYYKVIREKPYLTLSQIWSITHSPQQIIIRFHRYMPERMGYLFFWILYQPLTWKELLYSFYIYLSKKICRHVH